MIARAALFAAAGALGGGTVVDVSQFDQRCDVDADCVAVAANVCDGCADAAIRADERARYEAAAEDAAAWCGVDTTEDAFCGDRGAVCAAGMCTVSSEEPARDD